MKVKVKVDVKRSRRMSSSIICSLANVLPTRHAHHSLVRRSRAAAIRAEEKERASNVRHNYSCDYEYNYNYNYNYNSGLAGTSGGDGKGKGKGKGKDGETGVGGGATSAKTEKVPVEYIVALSKRLRQAPFRVGALTGELESKSKSNSVREGRGDGDGGGDDRVPVRVPRSNTPLGLPVEVIRFVWERDHGLFRHHVATIMQVCLSCMPVCLSVCAAHLLCFVFMPSFLCLFVIARRLIHFMLTFRPKLC